MMTAALGILAAPVAQAEVPDLYLFLEGSFVMPEERIPEGDNTLGWRLGFGNELRSSSGSRTGLEIAVFGNPLPTTFSTGDDQKGFMLDLTQHFYMNNWTPYVFAGLGMVGEHNANVSKAFPGVEAGGGILFPIGPMHGRAGLSAMSVRNDALYANRSSFVDYRLSIGLLFGLGDWDQPAAPAPTPTRVVDSDGDGLPDSKDACPSTPASTADGCPPAAPAMRTDSDNDGIYDDQDECECTLEGLKVDAKGCAVATEEQSIVLKGVNFLPSSATLTPEAKVVLEAAVAGLSGQAGLKVELGGHTDSQGADAANKALSQRRADSVRQYLIDKGIDGARLTAVGYGESEPIADNNTREGRTENRRVELKIVK
ncbi:MAG: OmpA family protein [Nevskiaceae bacterium]